MISREAEYPELQPPDERTALAQRLDHYRSTVAAALVGVSWSDASRRVSPATDLTIAGIVKHLAWAEDRWFQGRLLGAAMPAPWNEPGADDPDHAMQVVPGDTVDRIAALYAAACKRSRAALDACSSLSQPAAVPSFGIGPVNLRWILVHMIDETARHAGHLDLLRDCLHGSRRTLGVEQRDHTGRTPFPNASAEACSGSDRDHGWTGFTQRRPGKPDDVKLGSRLDRATRARR